MHVRIPDWPIHDCIAQRWSSRALLDKSLSDEILFTLFEAARFAPSSYNNQPWYFIYGKKGTPAWNTLFSLLVPFNQEWAQNGSMLMLITSKNDFHKTGKPSRTHSFDTGAAVENMAIQATAMGLVMHGMEGFDYDAARIVCEIPKDYTVEAMFVIGYPGDANQLSPALQTAEKATPRKPIQEFISEGVFLKK